LDKRPRHYATEVIERLKAGATEDEALAGVPEKWHGLTLAHVQVARDGIRNARIRRRNAGRG